MGGRPFHGAGAGAASFAPASAPSTSPSNVQVILQGTAAPNTATMFACSSETAVCPGYGDGYTLYYGDNQTNDLCEIGWQSVAGAANYAIYRTTNGGAPALIATISAATAASNYTSYVSNQGGNPYLTNINCSYKDTSAANVVSDIEYPPVNLTGSVTSGSNVFTVTAVKNNTLNNEPGVVTAGQGMGGPGLIPGTTINAFGSGGTTGTGSTGTYQLSQAATESAIGGTYGTQYFPNTAYTYYVEAEVGGVWSDPSAYAILPYIVDGQYILCGGNFGSGTATGAAPTATPLGYSNALEFSASESYSVAGLYAGNSAADQALNVAGYKYLNVASYTTTAGINFVVQTEVPGDNIILPYTELSEFGFGNLTPNEWTTYKILLSDIQIDDAWSGSGVQQNSLYKVILQYNYSIGSATIFWEMWLSVD